MAPSARVVSAPVVVALTGSVVSSLTGVAVSAVVSSAVSGVVSPTCVMAEWVASVVVVPGTLVVVELDAIIVLRPDAAVSVTESELLIAVLGVCVVAGARVMAALAENEVAPVLVALVPRAVEGVAIGMSTLVEVVAIPVVAATAGDVAPVSADSVMAP